MKKLNIYFAVCMVVVLVAGCGGGGGGGGVLPMSAATNVSSGDYSAPAEGPRVSMRSVPGDGEFVYQLSLPEPGRTAAVQIELAYDPAAVSIKSVHAVGPMAGGISAFNDRGDGTATVAAASARMLEAGGAIIEVAAAAKGGRAPDGGVSITGYELTNIEGKRLGRSSLTRVVRRGGRPAESALKCGDMDGDGRVTASDAVKALRTSIGAGQAGEPELFAGDMAPMDEPDGLFTVADAELILRRAEEIGVYGCGTPGTIAARPFGEARIGVDPETRERIISDSVVVMFQSGVTAETVDGITAAHRLSVVGRNSVTATWEFRVDEAGRTATMAALAADPNVASVELNPVVTAALTPNDPNFTSAPNENRWGYEKIQAPAAWDITTGAAGTVIAVVDTGVDTTHPEFSGRIAPGYNFVSGTTDEKDDHGHGTHVSGIAASMGNNGIGMAGGCWNCRIMGVKVLDASGSGSMYGVQSGITWAARNGARVINLSLGAHFKPSRSDITTIQNARALGAVVVVAAGNSSLNVSNFTPAGVKEALTVGSTSTTDERSWFSNYGDGVDIAAPGEDIYSTFPTYYVTMNDQGVPMNYALLSGTSMATPMVSGIAGLLFSLSPVLTPDQAENILKSNADAITTDRPIGGRLNAFKSVSAAGGGSNLPPTVSVSATPASGDAPLTVSFEATCADADGTCASYDWDFGDGSLTTTTTNTVSHVYTAAGTYNAGVTATDNLGAASSANTQVVVTSSGANQSPVVSISADKTSGQAPLTVRFTGTATDPDGTIASAFWDFGDGRTAPLRGSSIRNKYQNPGTYEASLTATDNLGATTKKTITITVTP